MKVFINADYYYHILINSNSERFDIIRKESTYKASEFSFKNIELKNVTYDYSNTNGNSLNKEMDVS